jgi:aldose 1-epimerase
VSVGDGRIAPSGEQVEISFGDQLAVVVEVGGGLRSYSAAGRDVLDGDGIDKPSASGRGQVLVPWPNRLQDGSYEFDGRSHQLPLTEPEHSNAIHGLARWALWRIGEREADRVVEPSTTSAAPEGSVRRGSTMPSPISHETTTAARAFGSAIRMAAPR